MVVVVIRWLGEVRWLEAPELRWLGQTTPASEGTVKQGFSNAEKILLAGVLISAIGLTVNVLSVTGYLRPRGER